MLAISPELCYTINTIIGKTAGIAEKGVLHMFLHQLEEYEANAFLTLAAEMIEDDGEITAEEDALLDEYKEALRCPTFVYDPTACAAARDILAQLNEVGKRKVYMELYNFAICDHFEDPAERRSLNELREAMQLDPHICRVLERCVRDLAGVYAEIERALEAEGSPIVVDYDS